MASSCNTTTKITIEIPEPARKELPSRIQSLLLVNRTVNEKYSDIKVDSLQKIFYKEGFNYDTVIYDLTAVDTTLQALGELLFESGRYDFVIPEDRFLAADKNTFFSKEMPWDEVSELCEIYNTDAILSLDLFSLRVSSEFEKDSYFDPFRNGFVSASAAQMKVLYDAMFRVYDPSVERVLVREFFKDTLVWENVAGTTFELFEDFTPVKQALSEAGIAIALDFSEKISTNWRVEQRPLFTKGDKKLKEAGILIDGGEWKQALALWKEISDNSKSKSIKSKAEFNMAIGNEIEGDIDNAIHWALNSYNSMFRPLTYEYLEALKSRKRELKK